MRLLVKAVDDGGDPHVVELADGAAACAWDTVLAVLVPRRTSIDELEPALKDLRPPWLRDAQAVVLRMHAPDAQQLLADADAIDALQRRCEDRPVLVAHPHDGAIELTSLAGDDLDAAEAAELVRALRHAEHHALLELPGVMLPANDDFHYLGPNGLRYESFIRVGTAIQSIDVLDAVAFWLQPHLAGRPLVLLDTWTIISLALNLDRYAAQAGLPSPAVTAVECQRTYREDGRDLRARLESHAAQHRDKRPPVMLLSSVVSTGGLVERLTDVCRQAGFDEVRPVGIFGSESAPGEIFCKPVNVGQYWPPDEPPTPAPPIVRIAPSSYTLELTVEPTRARIALPNAEEAWGFFDRYRGYDCLAVHRDQHDRRRHHMIHLDVGLLVRKRALDKQLQETLATIPEIDVVIAPEHAAAIELSARVHELLGSKHRIVRDGRGLTNLPPDEHQALMQARRILLVDDVLITGTRLDGYRHYLRTCDFLDRHPPPEIHMLVGVARVDDNKDLQGLVDMVDTIKRFHPVEKLLLPHWDDTECPWCWELEQLRERDSAVPLSDQMRARLEALEDRDNGLRDNLFLPWSEGGEPLPVSSWKLGPGSIFHADTQGELFAAVASAVQSLRSAGDLLERPAFPLAKVLDPAYWLNGRYYDLVLKAAILRAARPHDLRVTLIEDKLKRHVRRRLDVRASRELRGELLLGIGRGQLPLPADPRTIEDTLADPAADASVASLLRRVLAQPG